MPIIYKREIKTTNLLKDRTFPLDGAGIIYPYAAKKDWTNEYRVEARTAEAVQPHALKKAAEEMHTLFPYFFSRIVKVGSEYRMKLCNSYDIVAPDSGLCKPFDIDGVKPLIRILYTERTIALELFHSVTDGHGANAFFTEFLLKYKKYAYGKYPSVYVGSRNEALAGTDDLYEKIYQSGGRQVSRIMPSALRWGRGREVFPLSVGSVCAETSALVECAHMRGVTLTELMCAVHIYALMQSSEKKGKIKISVPVDIRRFFGEETMRNASLYILVECDAKKFSGFDNLLLSVKEQFDAQLTRENMQNLAYTNVKTAKLKIFRLLPLPLKKACLQIGYSRFGENQFTSTLTNLGKISLPPELDGMIESVSFILCENRINPLNASLSSFDGITRLTVSSTVQYDDFISAALEILCNLGIPAVKETRTSAVSLPHSSEPEIPAVS